MSTLYPHFEQGYEDHGDIVCVYILELESLFGVLLLRQVNLAPPEF